MIYLKLHPCWDASADGQGEGKAGTSTALCQEEMLEAKPPSKYQVIAFLF